MTHFPYKQAQLNPRLLTPRALAGLLILFTIVAYLPAVGAGYIWDDDTLLTANPELRSVEGLGQIWRGEELRDYTPVTLSVFWFERRIFGENPAGYHVSNILLHALSAVLLWLALGRLRVPGAWFGALLFAIHPVNVASVAWIAELKNTLSTALFLGAVLTWLGSLEGRNRWMYPASLGLFVLAVLGKGAVVTLPAVLLLCLLWRNRKVTPGDLVLLAPYAVISIIGAWLTIRYQARAPHYGLLPDSFEYRISRAGADIWYYLGALFWPVGLSPMRQPWAPDLGSPLSYLPAAGAVGVFAIFAWRRQTWGRPFLFAYAYYAIMLLPVLGFVWMALMQETPGADWWQYLAAPGVFALLGSGAVIAARRWRFLTPLLVIAVALLLVQTWRRAAIYQSLQTYCEAVTAEDPHAWTLENNLGILLKREGHFAESEERYRQSIADNPRYVEAHFNLGNTLGAEGRTKDQAAEYQRAADLAPDNVGIRFELCEALVAAGNRSQALKICTEVDNLAHKSNQPGAVDAAARLRRYCEGSAGS